MYNFTQPHFLIIAINKSHHYVPFGLKKNYNTLNIKYLKTKNILSYLKYQNSIKKKALH